MEGVMRPPLGSYALGARCPVLSCRMLLPGLDYARQPRRARRVGPCYRTLGLCPARRGVGPPSDYALRVAPWGVFFVLWYSVSSTDLPWWLLPDGCTCGWGVRSQYGVPPYHPTRPTVTLRVCDAISGTDLALSAYARARYCPRVRSYPPTLAAYAVPGTA
eukprot:3941281-Rhodomonas_salina.1